jgi:hypothetical protein
MQPRKERKEVMFGIDNKKNEIKLGQEAKCLVTGFEGVVVTVYEYLHGCMRCEIQPKVKEDGTLPESRVLDAPQLEITKKKRCVAARAAKKTVAIGEKAKDSISAYEGIVIGRATFLNGCHRVGLQKNVLDKDGKVFEDKWFDEAQLAKVKNPVVIKTTERKIKTGGPAPYKAESRFKA